MSAAPSTPARLWIFRGIIAVAVPAVFFLGLEGALRFAGSGRDMAFFIPDDQPGYLRTNPAYTARFMPGSFDLRPLHHRVAEKKPANTVRIVVLGESAVQGIPVPAFGLVPQLRALLRARYPDRTIEVINTGVVAINSHVVYQIARDAARLSPDLFVVYLGNNEVVGPYGPGCTYLSAMPPRWVIRASIWAKGTRTGQLLGAVLGRLAGNRAPQAWGGMAMFLDHAVRGDDPRLEVTYANFGANLRDILRTARGAGAKCVVGTVVANLADSPPFLSLHRPGLEGPVRDEWQAAFNAGKLAWKLGEHDTARAQLEQAHRLDPQYADTVFLLGSLDAAAGRGPEARTRFLEALQWDALRFRPAPRLNEIARQIAAAEPGATLVDTARELGSDPASTGPIPGRELLLEHVHPDWEGNYRIARLLAEGAERALFPAAPADGAGWLDSAGVAAAIGYTPVERFGLLQRTALITREPPFTNQLTYDEDQARVQRDMDAAETRRRDPEAQRRAQAAVRSALARDPENVDLAMIGIQLASDTNDLDWALAELQRAQRLQPANFAWAADEAIKLAQLGRVDEGRRRLLETAAACGPRDLAKLAPALAEFHERTNQLENGRRWFDEAIARPAAAMELRFFRGRLAQAAGDIAAAERDFRAVLENDPGNEAALEALVALLSSRGDAAAADELSLAHAGTQPMNQQNHLRVARIREARGQTAEATAALAAAAASGALPLPLHLRLANQLYADHRRDEAVDRLATAWRLAQAEGDRESADSILTLIRRMRAQP